MIYIYIYRFLCVVGPLFNQKVPTDKREGEGALNLGHII